MRLADGAEIRPAELGGQRSEGVLCSPMELGMSRWHEGLLECPASIANGAPLSQFIPAQDVIVEIDNKSLTHRPDLWGHYGFARELAAIFGRELAGNCRWPTCLCTMRCRPTRLRWTMRTAARVTAACEFKVAAAVPSPLVIQRWHALGQRTYNLMVDVTNYAMWELAQPTHAFDGDRVHAIRVARMGQAGTFVTLDGQERQMLPDDLLIWDEREPVALAGIMGGLHSEVRADTTRVLLESANFKAARIRRTSVRLDLRTDAAQRFEKSQPPWTVARGIARILQLIQDSGANPEVTSRFTVQGNTKDRYRPLEMPRRTLSSMAGKEIPDGEVLAILRRWAFRRGSRGSG